MIRRQFLMQVGTSLSASVVFAGCLGQGSDEQDSAPAEGGEDETTAMDANDEPPEADGDGGYENEPSTDTEEQTEGTGDGGSGSQDGGSQGNGLATYTHNGDSIDLTRAQGILRIRNEEETTGETETITDLTGAGMFGARTDEALTGLIAIGDTRHLQNQMKVMDAGAFGEMAITIVIPQESTNEVDFDPSEIPGVGIIEQGDNWTATAEAIFQNGEQVVASALGTEIKQGVNQISGS